MLRWHEWMVSSPSCGKWTRRTSTKEWDFWAWCRETSMLFFSFCYLYSLNSLKVLTLLLISLNIKVLFCSLYFRQHIGYFKSLFFACMACLLPFFMRQNLSWCLCFLCIYACMCMCRSVFVMLIVVSIMIIEGPFCCSLYIFIWTLVLCSWETSYVCVLIPLVFSYLMKHFLTGFLC